MKDEKKTKAQLIKELEELRRQVAERKKSETERLFAKQAGKRAEEALRESEKTFRTLAENANDGIFITVGEGIQSFANDRAGEITGYSVAELLKTEIKNLVHPNEVQKIMERYKKRLAGEPFPFQYETLLIHKNGKSVPVELTAAKTVWHGQPADLVIVRDITERRQAEEALQKSEMRYRTLASTRDSMYFVDRECRYQFMNGAHLLRLGVSLDEVIGRSYGEFHSGEDTIRFADRVATVFETSNVVQIEHRSERDNKYFLRTFSPVKDLQGNITGVTVISKDITERKQAEEALRKERDFAESLINTAQTIILLLDPEGRIVRFNPYMEKLSGYSLCEILGKDWFSTFLPPQDQLRMKSLFSKAIDDIQTRGNVNPIVTKDGRERIIEWYDKTLKDEKGNTVGLLSIGQDITERKRAEELLRVSEARLKAQYQGSPIPTFTWQKKGEDFQLVDYNNAAKVDTKGEVLKFFGKTANEMYQDRPEILQDIHRCFTKKEVIKRELRSQHFMPGRTMATTYAFVPPDLIMVHAEDITERKQVEKEVEDLARFPQENPNPVLRVEPDGLIIYANEASKTLLFDWNTEAGGYLPASLCKLVVDAVAGKTKITVDISCGERVFFIMFSPIHDAEYVNIYGIDITERKQAEELIQKSEALLKEAQHVAHIGHWEVNDLAGSPKWSEEIFHIFGLDPAQSEPSFKGLQKFIHPDDWDNLNNAVTKANIEGIPFDIEFRLFRPDASIRWMNAKGSIIRDGEGHIVRTFGTAQDITERKQAEEEVRASREQLRALAGRLQAVREEERTNMARQIHDELGGALTGLKIDFSLLRRAALKVEDETVRASLLAGTDSMIESIDSSIHTVRRIAMELRPGILDDLGLVAALEWQLKDFEKRTDIRCEFFPMVEDIALDADLSTTLFRIFQETLTNVARHAGATEVHVRWRVDADGSVLEIEDNGKGIKKEKILSSKSLGLLGMRERAQMFGGRTTVTGTPGKGTKVMVKIPLWEKRKMDRDQKG